MKIKDVKLPKLLHIISAVSFCVGSGLTHLTLKIDVPMLTKEIIIVSSNICFLVSIILVKSKEYQKEEDGSTQDQTTIQDDPFNDEIGRTEVAESSIKTENIAVEISKVLHQLNGRPHIQPMSYPINDITNQMSNTGPSDYVFTENHTSV